MSLQRFPIHPDNNAFLVHSEYPSWNTVESTVLRWKQVLGNDDATLTTVSDMPVLS